MLELYMGDIKELHKKYANIKFTDDIMYELCNNSGLFGYNDLYFIYNNNMLSDKEELCRFKKLANSYNGLVICFVESIDKKSIFYKEFKSDIICLGDTHNELTLKDKVNLFYKDINNLKHVADTEFISFLYNIYYDRRTKYKAQAVETINYILEGRLTVANAKRLFLLMC